MSEASSNFSLCLHVLDCSTCTCFALNKDCTYVYFKGLRMSMLSCLFLHKCIKHPKYLSSDIENSFILMFQHSTDDPDFQIKMSNLFLTKCIQSIFNSSRSEEFVHIGVSTLWIFIKVHVHEKHEEAPSWQWSFL